MKKTYLPRLACLLALAGLATGGIAGCAETPTSDSTGQYVDDAAITTKVKAALIGDQAVKSFEIHVTTFKGVVQLSGFVDNADQKLAAKNDAESVPGVKSVTNNISLKTS